MADRVTFTKSSAERIAQAVRIVEAGNRDTGGLPTAPRFGSSFKLRLGSFTGNWQTGTSALVTLHGSTSTFLVYNYCNPALDADTSSTSETRYVIFGDVAGTQSVLEIQMENTNVTCKMTFGNLDLKSIEGWDANSIQLLGHNSTGPCLQWYSITTCSTAAA